MQDLTLSPADQVPLAALHDCFVEAFSDYLIGPFRLDLSQFSFFLRRQAVDLSLSRVACAGAEPLAFALVAPREQRWRVAGMGARPAARGSGAAPQLLDDFIARGLAARQQALELEVFAQNERAVRLYQGRGFVARHELHGYEGTLDASQGMACILERPALADALRWLRQTAAARLQDLPLQVMPEVLAVADTQTPLLSWRRGSAQLVFALPDASSVQIHSLIDTDAAQRDAEALLRALAVQHAGRRLRVPQIQRLDIGGAALRRLGFAPLPLHQLLMVRDA